ncbi:type IV pilus biogenesis/stability protein PilW [Alteromonas sp. SM 2104]|nr:type IV pilus biogenesis/stability protein PilW [Alteromonas oceanisediminis]
MARRLILVCLLVLTGCVSEPMPEGFERSDDFDQVEAAKTRISLGLTYLKNGNYSQAKVNLDRALEFAPRHADAHYSMAYYYQLVGEVKRAQEYYENALSLDPRNPDIANSYGAFLCQQGDYPKAKSFFDKAVNSQTYANSAETYENMALCSLSQGAMEDAVKYLNTALNHQPTRAKSLFLLSEVYIETGEYQNAKDTLKRYLRVARVSAESLWLAVQIENGLGDEMSAKGYGDMLLQLYPGHPLTARYLALEPVKSPAKQVTQKAKTQPVEQQQPVDSVVIEKPVVVVEKSSTQPATSTTRPDVAPVSKTEKSPTERETQHVVKAGENLYRISLQHNVKLQRLIEWNQLDPSGAIKQGMTLWVVDPTTVND